jgi:hypothetical protein
LSDRRRLVVAVAITLIALPSLWLMSRGGDSGAPNVATAGMAIAPAHGSAPERREETTGPAVTPAPTAPTTVADPMGRVAAGYLAPPVSTPAPGPVAIAVPAAADETSVVGEATYRSSITDATACVVPGAPLGVTVVVTNRNNNRSITCRAIPPSAGPAGGIVLSTSSFAAIADLTDAPVPVDADW